MVTHIPEGVATVLICEVDLLRCDLDFLLDVNNWTGSGRTELSEQLYNHRSNQRRVVREKNTSSRLLVDKDRVREGSDSQVRVGVLIQVHVARQRVAKIRDSYSLAGQNLKKEFYFTYF